LTKGQHALVDDEDYERVVAAGPWFAYHHASGTYYPKHTMVDRRTLPLANFILGAPVGQIVDHIDRNPLNNCKSNLRVVTRTVNAQNRRKNSNASSKYYGVYWNSYNNNWRAEIRRGTKRYTIGSFRDEVIAARAYDKKALELYGGEARINFPVTKETSNTQED
jgi:HNH endonuclease